MAEKSDIDKVITSNLQVDEDGIRPVKSFSIEQIIQLGVVDVSSFLQGLLDAENDDEFSESQIDYVKGYKYGKTGSF